jgi:hypothetical protein
VYNREDAFEFCIHAIQQIPIVEPEVCAFLLDSSVVENLCSSCAAFSKIVPFVSPETRSSLFTFLHTLTRNELRFGHVALENGLKQIQTGPTRPVQTVAAHLQEVECYRMPRVVKSQISFGMARKLSMTTSPFVGWRELSALLILAPPNADTLLLMTDALNVHPRALTPAFVVLLSRFDDLTVNQWIGSLFGGSQQRQMLAFDLLTELGDRMWPLLEHMVIRYVRDFTAPQLLRCRAIRVIVVTRERNPGAFRELEADLKCVTDPAEMDALAGGVREVSQAQTVRIATVAGEKLPPLTAGMGGLEPPKRVSRSFLSNGRRATSVIAIRNRR